MDGGAMFGDDMPDLAVRGEGGIDVYIRQNLPDQGRSRFRCVASFRPGAQDPDIHEPGLVSDPARLTRTLQALDAVPALSDPFRLDDATTYPRIAAFGDPLALFLRVDFLRAWALADLGLSRLRAALDADGAAVLTRQGHLPAQVGLAFDFNRISVGAEIASQVLDAVARVDPRDDGTAFALRMLGDLCLRGGQAALALRCFEGALAIGDNPHRRARARAAALALGSADALARHCPAAATG
jgi:hypothetical protein